MLRRSSPSAAAGSAAVPRRSFPRAARTAVAGFAHALAERLEDPDPTVARAAWIALKLVTGRKLAPNVGQRLRHLDEIEVGSHRFILLAGKFRDQAKNPST